MAVDDVHKTESKLSIRLFREFRVRNFRNGSDASFLRHRISAKSV